MLAKYWKKIGLVILIIAVLWNLISKLFDVISFDTAIANIRVQVERLNPSEDNEEEEDDGEAYEAEVRVIPEATENGETTNGRETRGTRETRENRVNREDE
ncbi:MAG: hypothetical protein FWC79_05270 [Oscillospiraceae bacterium]|nr:hypothetical protein [Oscillospiraceae bacterium]